MDRTESKIDTPVAREGSRPVRYELIDKDGELVRSFERIGDASFFARHMFPDQEQDPDRTGKGWDIQVVGAATGTVSVKAIPY